MTRRPAPQRLRVRFFSCGRGDSILLRSGPFNILIDAGRGHLGKLGDNLVQRRLVPFFARQGIRKLDAFFITHPHWDHFGDPGRLRTAVSFDRIYTNLDTPHLVNRIRADKTLGDHYIRKIWRHPMLRKLPFVVVRRGRVFRFGRLKLEVLWPPATARPASQVSGTWPYNNRSLVIRVTFGLRVFLLMGDVYRGGEKRMMKLGAQPPGRADVIKLGHHGVGLTEPAFLRRVRPRYAVASLGDRWGRRIDRVLPGMQRLLRRHRVTLLRTDRQGDIVFETDGRSLVTRSSPQHVYVPNWRRRRRRRRRVGRRRRPR